MMSQDREKLKSHGRVLKTSISRNHLVPNFKYTPSNQQLLLAQNRLRIEQRSILRRFCWRRRLAWRRFPLTEMLFTHDRFLSTVTV